MKTSLSRQVLVFKKSLGFQPKPCLLNKYIAFVESVVSQESLRGSWQEEEAQMVSCQPGVLQRGHSDSWLLGSAWVALKGQLLFTNL